MIADIKDLWLEGVDLDLDPLGCLFTPPEPLADEPTVPADAINDR